MSTFICHHLRTRWKVRGHSVFRFAKGRNRRDRPINQGNGVLKYRVGLRAARGSGDDVSDRVSVIAFPDDRCLRLNMQFDLRDTFYGSRSTGAINPIEDAITLREEEPSARDMRTRTSQIRFFADNHFDVLGN